MFQAFTRSLPDAGRPLKIGFVTGDKKIAAQAKGFASAKRDGVEFSLIEGKPDAAKSSFGDIAVFAYALNVSDLTALRELDRFMSERPAGIPVIVLAQALDDELVRLFLRLRVADWIKTPVSSNELIAACRRATHPSAAARPDAKCITFTGARGGVGTTTLAIHAALLIAGQGAARTPTCLVDLDLVSGACADYLDLTPAWQLDELVPNPERLDTHMMDVMTTAHKAGISVLSAPHRHGRQAGVSEELITRTLDLALHKFHGLVIDLPRYAEAWTDSVIHGSNQVYVVTDFSIPGLKAAKRMAAEIAERAGGEAAPRIIVNRYERSLFGSGISKHEINEILRDAFAGFVGIDKKLMAEAIDRGIPTTDIKAKNVLMTDLARILKAGDQQPGRKA